MLDRLISLFVAMSLAFLVWLYMRSRDQETFDNVEVPVSIQLAASQKDAYELELAGPSKVAISFSGPQSRIREVRTLVQRDELRIHRTLAVPVERLDESRYFDTVIIEAGDIHPPTGVTCQVHEGRNRISVSVSRLVEQRLPVRFQAAGDATISQWTAEPAAVLVRPARSSGKDDGHSLSPVCPAVARGAAGAPGTVESQLCAACKRVEGQINSCIACGGGRSTDRSAAAKDF